MGLQLELEDAVAFFERLLLLPRCLELLLGGLVLLLQAGDQLLELHAAELGLQLFGEFAALLPVALLGHQVEHDGVHEVNEVDGRLDYVLLGLGQVATRVPARLHEEEVVEAGIQLPVELAQVLPPVAFGDTMLFALVVQFAVQAVSAFLSAQLLQRRLAPDVPRSNEGQDF